MPKKISRRTPEDELRDLFEAFGYIKEFELALDGGANAGTWTRPMAERFECVVAVEPDIGTFNVLRQNLADLDNIIFRQVALGDEKRHVGLAGHTSTGRHVAFPGDDVKMVTIDSMKLDRCDFMKLDLEGAEILALKGASETIRAHRPVLLIEYHLTKRYGFTYRALDSLFGEFAYQQIYKEWPNLIAVPK